MNKVQNLGILENLHIEVQALTHKHTHTNTQGLDYLAEHDLLTMTPEGVAGFLLKGEGLNKTVIGNYLGERLKFSSFFISMIDL